MSDYSCVLCATVSKKESAEPIEFIYCAECGMTTTHRVDVVPPIQPTLEERLEALEARIEALEPDVGCSFEAWWMDMIMNPFYWLAECEKPSPEPAECRHDRPGERSTDCFTNECSDCGKVRIAREGGPWSDWV